MKADYRMNVGTDVVKSASDLYKDDAKEFLRSMIFTGKLAFRTEKFYYRILHKETAFAIQRDLHWSGVPNMILPVRMDL